jgi:hypothetical protein
MAATANITLVANDWTELAAAPGNTDVLITFAAGKACQIAVAAAKPNEAMVGHALLAGSDSDRFSAELEGTEKVWGRSYQTGVIVAVTK